MTKEKETENPSISEVLNSPDKEELTAVKPEKKGKKESVRGRGRPEGTQGFLPVSCYFPEELKEDLKQDAKQERRTLNSHIIYILTQYLKRKKKPTGGTE